MTIREANSDDAPEIAKIQIKAWQTGYEGIMPKEYLDSLSLEEKTKQWSDSLAEKGLGINLVIEFNGSIVGFCVFGPIRDEDLSNKNVGELVAINILPSYWNKGLGSEAIEHIIAASIQRKWEALYLWVLKENIKARRVYEALGFVEDGTEKFDSSLTGHEMHEVRYVKVIQKEIRELPG